MIRLALLVLLVGQSANAASCRDVTYLDNSYTVCQAQAGQDDVRLFLNNGDGTPYGQFYTLANDLSQQGLDLKFAMNAGMFHPNLSPVGHYVESGIEQMRVIPNAGPGNFGMVPNGVFCIAPDRFDVFETTDFIAQKPNCTYATQSGPMLVIDGALHPRFLKNSEFYNIRNGVGVLNDTAYFVISNDRVNFYTFASFFRDNLKTPNALFLDGSISRLYAPDVGRNDLGWSVGPIVGVVAAQQGQAATPEN